MKTNQLRAMMLTVMLVITTLGGTVWAQPLIVKGTVTDGSDGSPLVGCADGEGNIPWNCYEPTRAVQD